MSRGLKFIQDAKAGIDFTRSVKFPGTDHEFIMRPLAIDEEDRATATAYHYLQELKLPRDMYTAAMFTDEEMIEALAIACRDPDDPSQPLFRTGNELRKNITKPILNKLMAEYVALVNDTNPSVDDLTAVETEEITELLKKKEKEALIAYGSRLLATYMLTTASQAGD